MQDPSERPEDRRNERRRRVFLQADICTLDGSPITTCAIQDTSRSGCKIISDDTKIIPDELILSIRGLGEKFVGRVMWRNANMAGIKFLNQITD